MLSDIASARESSCSASTVASLRRPSRAAGSSHSYGSRYTSQSHRPASYRTDQFGRQVLQQKLENTYRIEPNARDRFQPGVVHEMLGN